MFERDLDEVLARAQNVGINGALAVGLHLKTYHDSPVEAGFGTTKHGEAFWSEQQLMYEVSGKAERI